MPVNRKMMKAMKDQYGKKKGEDIYYAVEQKMKSKKKKGYAAGGYVNCGASMQPNGKSRK